MQLITNLLVILRMAELALVDYFVMGEAIGIVAIILSEVQKIDNIKQTL
jgi:hypothetical protein